MFYILLFLFSVSVMGIAIYKMIKEKQIKISTIVKIIIPITVFILCIIDLFALCVGGINKIVDFKKITGYSHNPISYSLAVMVDHDGEIYLASGMLKANFLPKGEVYKNIRVTYLPCTRTVIKLEQRPEDSYYIPIDDTARKSNDGYRELYDFSRDTLPFTIAMIGIYLIILLIVRIIRSRKNE